MIRPAHYNTRGGDRVTFMLIYGDERERRGKYLIDKIKTHAWPPFIFICPTIPGIPSVLLSAVLMKSTLTVVSTTKLK